MAEEVLDLFKDWTPEMIRSFINIGKDRRESEAKREARVQNFKKGPEKVKELMDNPEEKDRWIRRSFLSHEAQERARQTRANRTSEERRETSRKCSEAQEKGVQVRNRWTPERRKEFSKTNSEAQIKVWTERTPEERREFSIKVTEGWTNKSPKEMEDYSRSCSENQRRYLAGLTPKEMETRMRNSLLSDEAILKSRRTCAKLPSRPEIFLGMYIEGNFPGEVAYTGDGKAGIVIGGKIPDFKYINKDKVIEELGGLGYYHFYEDEQMLIEHYRKYGYECIVVWEWDCYFPEELDKIFKTRGG